MTSAKLDIGLEFDRWRPLDVSDRHIAAKGSPTAFQRALEVRSGSRSRQDGKMEGPEKS